MDEIEILEILSSNREIEDNKVFTILSDKKCRQIFIKQYDFFYRNNQEKIAFFIDSNYNLDTPSDFKVDLLDLAFEINYYSKKIDKLIREELKMRRDYIFKLSALDYLNHFYPFISNKNDYLELSEYLFCNSSNNIVVFQAAINLLPRDNVKYENYLLKRLTKENVAPFLYYRLVDNLISYDQFKSFRDFLNSVLEIIVSTNNLSVNQKQELKGRIVSST